MDVQDSSTQTEPPPVGQASRLRLFGKLLLLGLSILGPSWVVVIKNNALGESPETAPAALLAGGAQEGALSSSSAGPVNHEPGNEPRRPAPPQPPAPAVALASVSPTVSARRDDEAGADTDLNDKAPSPPLAALYTIDLPNDWSARVHKLLTEMAEDTRLAVSSFKGRLTHLALQPRKTLKRENAMTPESGGPKATTHEKHVPSRPSNSGCELINPATNRVPIHFLLNGEEQLLGAGKSRTWNFDRPAIIEFHRGRDFGVAQYSVSNESFTFKVTRQGWDLVATSDPGLTEPD